MFSRSQRWKALTRVLVGTICGNGWVGCAPAPEKLSPFCPPTHTCITQAVVRPLGGRCTFISLVVSYNQILMPKGVTLNMCRPPSDHAVTRAAAEQRNNSGDTRKAV